jgi:uncharacterized protein
LAVPAILSKGDSALNIGSFARKHPISLYFVLAYGIAWIGSIAAAGPKFLRNESLDLADAMVMFVPMLAGPSIAGIGMTALVDGRAGLRELFARMRRWRVRGRWYAAAILIPPVLILAVLFPLSEWVSPVFAPNFLPMFLVIGLLAGFFEEIGWTGYAYPRMEGRYGALAAAVYLGLLWSTWHVVADYLGSSAMLGAYWLPHFLAFMTISMTAMRVLISWVYCNTRSVLLAQIMHASSTGFLGVFGPAGLSAANDTQWYAVYGAVLWILVVIVIARYGAGLTREQNNRPQMSG